MGTNCAPLVADLFLFCYERDFMLSLSEENQSGVRHPMVFIFLYLFYLLELLVMLMTLMLVIRF